MSLKPGIILSSILVQSLCLCPAHPPSAEKDAGFKVFTKIREMQVKPTITSTSPPLGWLLLNKQKITSVGEEVEKWQPLRTAVGNVKWCNFCGKQYGASSKS